jgi:hypothetical protein
VSRDITSGVQTSRPAAPDVVAAAGAVACVVSRARTAADARLLLDVLGLTEVAPIARAVLRTTRKETR